MAIAKKIFKGLFSCFTNINSYNWVYKVVAFIGLVLRVALLPIFIPNVFELIAATFIQKLNFEPWLYEIVIRIILLIVDSLSLSNIFYWISYYTVGNSYQRDSIPAWGSVCYTIYYFVYMFIPIILIQYFYWWVIILTIIVYVIICAIIYFISAKVNTLPDSWIIRLIIHILVFIIISAVIIIIKIKL